MTLLSTVLLLAASALAQTPSDWDIHPDVLLTGADVSWGETIGSPSVVYNTRDSQYYMFFESRLATTDPDCPAGLWAIGLATSPNGLDNWTVRTQPIVNPAPNAASPTFHSCVAAHPGAIYRETAQGGIIDVFFKGEQADDACDGGAQSWGCGQYTGVGRYRIRFDSNGNFFDQTLFTTPVVSSETNFGYPKPLRYTAANGTTTWLMSYTDYPNVRIAAAPSPGGPWTDQGVILDVDVEGTTASWVENEFFSSALACRDAGALPFEVFMGGRDTRYAFVIGGGVGKAVSITGVAGSWNVGPTPFFSFLGDDQFRHWDVLRLESSNDYLMWYDERDASGNNQIRFTSTVNGVWSPTDVYDKQCDE